MPISDLHASTIIQVQAYFSFSRFACDPDRITDALNVKPDQVGRPGEVLAVRPRRTTRWLWNNWAIHSQSISKDVNEHLRELLVRLHGAAPRIRPEFGPPAFTVLWKGNYLRAGSGPSYDADVIAGIAALNAELGEDIYQIDSPDPAEPLT